ncbi:MAG: formylglycine-generating enzyme family protein [Treponema sp.]|jgi:formylglycine-generating enzyme required for sulfatase activity|nr:formylglycine-generating enzyme family protein [Treponema sp.]
MKKKKNPPFFRAAEGLCLGAAHHSGGAGIIFTTPAEYREMVDLAGGLIPGSGTAGVFIADRGVTLSPFRMAKYETTYQLWQEVYGWAVVHGYTFANPGKEGYPYAGTDDDAGKGTGGGGWTAAEKKNRPVTGINWRDAVVWCNAYSEMSGEAPVYYTDAAYTALLKTATNEEGTAAAADTAVMKSGANGYRLPTEAEWEYAARGGDTSAGAWNYTYAGTSTAGTGVGELGDYAWYDGNADYMGQGSSQKDNTNYGVHPVGTKAANGAGLHDMGGNLWEWCWDWYAGTVDTTAVTDPVWAGAPPGPVSGSYRVLRGGSWSSSAGSCGVLIRLGGTPNAGGDDQGFRVISR